MFVLALPGLKAFKASSIVSVVDGEKVLDRDAWEKKLTIHHLLDRSIWEVFR